MRNYIICFVGGICVGWLFLVCLTFNDKVEIIIKDRIIKQAINYKKNIEFSQDSLILTLKELNIKYPHIVLAQAQLETGNFTSKIFRECNNLFGMKEAKQRATTSKGTKRGHAHFDTWYESVLDYGLFQCKHMSKLSESEYFIYLGKNYAEDPNYINKLKHKANQNKKYFND